jgi:hypothetical protein
MFRNISLAQYPSTSGITAGVFCLKYVPSMFVGCSFGTLMGIYSTLLFLILLGRAAFVFPLSVLSNYMNRKAERTAVITFKHQVSITMFP